MGENEQETLGQRLRRLRRARHLTQRDLTDRAGVSEAFLSRLENDERRPSIHVIRKLALALDVSDDYLEHGRDVPLGTDRQLRLAEAEVKLRLGEEGDLRAAASELAALVDERADGVAAHARALLGLLAAKQGRHAEAVEHFESALETRAVRPATRPDVTQTLAASYVAIGKPVQAIQFVERALAQAEAEAAENPTLAVRYRTLLATVLSSTGKLDEARVALAEAMKQAKALDLPAARVSIYVSQARVARLQGKAAAALAAAAKAIALLELSEDTAQLARAHLLAGQFYTEDGLDDDARRHLEQAERLLEAAGGGDDMERGLVLAERAKLAARAGEPSRAHEYAAAAAELLRNDARHAPTASWALALAQAAEGDVDAADASFRSAFEGLERLRHWRQAAHLARDWKDALCAAGRTEDGYAVLERGMLLAVRDRPVRLPGLGLSR
jgi:transcriptional regulator with XRE-family HTH domain